MDTVTVLMSTYNGEKYLEQQIDSIMNQEDVYTTLVVRDDGSSDKTVDVVNGLITKYPDRISVISGENVGFKISFFRLLDAGLHTNSQYYAFSDQDDVWNPHKLRVAVENIKEKNSYSLYASAVTNTDEELNVIDVHQFNDMPVTLESAFTRPRLAGCTYVYTRKLAEVCSRINAFDDLKEPIPAHDFLVLAIALGSGRVIVDDDSYILHRWLKSSITSGGSGFLKRLKIEKNMVWGNNKYYSTSAKLFLEIAEDILTPDAKRYLKLVFESPESFSLRYKLLKNKKMNCGSRIGNIENKAKIILNRY